MEDEVMVWAYSDKNAETSVSTYYWSMDYDYIALYDADYNAVLQMGWDVIEDLSTLTITLDDASDVDNLTLGDAVYAWEMSHDFTMLVLQYEDGSITSFEAVGGTAEDVGVAMATLATE